MKETRRPKSKQLSLSLESPAGAPTQQDTSRSPSNPGLARFPRSAPTTSFQQRVIDQLARTRVIIK